MLVGRYSYTAFEPCCQLLAQKDYNFAVTFDRTKHVEMTEFSLNLIEKVLDSNRKSADLTISLHGVHCFLLPISQDRTDHFLNHLKDRPPYHERWFDDTTCAYADRGGSQILYQAASTLGELRKAGWESVYIPL